MNPPDLQGNAAVRTIATELPEVVVFEPKIHGDDRGFFFESYRRDAFAAAGIYDEFVQDNHSLSVRGVLRGLHYQIKQPQAKLIRVLRGEVLDVAVDVRRNSPTFLRHVAVVLSEKNRLSMYVPKGFAHGFYVVSDSAEFVYKCSDFYCPEGERGVRWNDPGIAVSWPIAEGCAPILSPKDAALPLIDDISAGDLPEFPS